jgi:hypothetical protein
MLQLTNLEPVCPHRRPIEMNRSQQMHTNKSISINVAGWKKNRQVQSTHENRLLTFPAMPFPLH